MLNDLSLLLPEIFMVLIVASLSLFEIFLPSFSHRFASRLNLLGLGVVGAVLAAGLKRTGNAFQGMFAADPFSFFFKFLFLAAAACTLVMKREESEEKGGAEFYLLLWSALLGMFFLVSSRNFLLLFISLELLTLSLYILAAYTQTGAAGARSSLRAIEAGLKYLILGSLASAFLLYGTSLIYAASGTLSFEKLGAFLRPGEKIPWLFLAGILLILSALGFKVAAVPFQVWVPDVYEGAPAPVVAFLSVASKSAGFAVLIRLFFEAFGPLQEKRWILFSLLAGLTLLYGNLGALVQKDMKRLLGFSSIGQAGFLLVALALPPEAGERPLLYYLIAYAFSNLTAFLVVSIVEKRGVSYQGLFQRSPLLAAGMFLAFLSLAGVPPLAGFFAKFFILLAAARSGLTGIVFLGAVSVAISLYYYLNAVRLIYFEKAEDPAPIGLSFLTRAVLLGLMAGIVVAGVWQAPFFRIVSGSALS